MLELVVCWGMCVSTCWPHLKHFYVLIFTCQIERPAVVPAPKKYSLLVGLLCQPQLVGSKESEQSEGEFCKDLD